MPFNNVQDYADYRDEGAWHQATYFKPVTPISGVIGRWVDFSYGTGLPAINFYASAPLTATALTNYTNKAVYTGPVPELGKTKHLHSLTVGTATSALSTFILADYLMYYPFVDTDSTDTQIMDNTATLPRYTTGENVQCFVVSQGGLQTSVNTLCTVDYTNSDGVSGRTTTFAIIGSPTQGVIVCAGNNASAATTTQCSPFIPLAAGDKGIRSIQSITMGSGIGGVCSFVLAYSIASIPLFSNRAQTEKTFFSRTGRAPQIYDGAFLQFLATVGGTSGIGVFRSSLTFVWG